jgi:hypothetical protein
MRVIGNNIPIILQAVIFSVFGIILMLLNRWFGSNGSEWLIAAASLVLFSIFNIIIGLKTSNYKHYISISFLVWVVLFFDLLLDALLISKVGLREYDPILKNYIIAFGFHFIVNIVFLTIKANKK